MHTNRLRERLAAGEPAYGGWCQIPSPFVAELLAQEGFDYICVDLQHGLIDFDALWPMLQALRWSEITPLVRVPFNHTPWPGKALDAGAEGVIIPMVSSSEDAERAVAACRYAPAGVRSFGPVRAGMGLGDDPAHVDREVLCFVMIETEAGVEHADEVCSTAGVDGVYLGPADLAVSMGVPLAEMFTARAHTDAIETVRQACSRHGLVPGIHVGSGAQAHELVAAGFRLCTVGTDTAFLRGAASRELAAAREGIETAASGSQGPYG